MCNYPNHKNDCTCPGWVTLTPELYKHWYEGGNLERYHDNRWIPVKGRDPSEISWLFMLKQPYRKAPIPHVHAEVIKAWAEGAKIEFRADKKSEWCLCNPTWNVEWEYRIKQN
jgi:hypothetical protein